MRVTDEMVLAACNAYERRAAAPSLEYWGEEHAADMRRAVEAALSRATAPEPEWEYGYEHRESDSGDIYNRGWVFPTADEAREHGQRRADDENAVNADDPDLPNLVCVVVRRPVVEWEPLPVGGETDGD